MKKIRSRQATSRAFWHPEADQALREASPQARWASLFLTEFERLVRDTDKLPPSPNAVRRPDWRSSSAKRLMPQLQIKTSTLRRWSTKLAVDMPFSEALGGPSQKVSRDLDEEDIIWLVPQISDEYRLEAVHWEVLPLEASGEKLLAAKTVKRGEFEEALRAKLQPLQ